MTVAFELVTHDAATPTAFIVILHGILGTGANFRSFARRLVNASPSWGAVLVDLRMHGGSKAMSPPYTVAACAVDLIELESRVPAKIRAILGHSFGGKVALDYLADRARRDPSAMQRLFLLDSNPSTRSEGHGSEGTLAILEMLHALPSTFPSRKDFIARVQSEGHSTAIAQWLAMNLVRTTDGDAFRFALDLDAIDALLRDYLARDLWSVLEPPPPETRIVAINGGRSNVYDESARDRLERDARATPERLVVHTLAEAGHWIHVDAFEATLAIVTSELPS